MNALSKIRFLPITIFVATLMLSVKLGDIWTGVTQPNDAPAIEVSAARAQDAPELPDDLAQAADPLNNEISEAVDGGVAADDPFGGEPAFEGEDAEDAAVQRLVTEDPTLLTPEEIELLQKLAERRDAIERREREVALREGLLEAAEIRINNKIAELQAFEQTISGLIETYDEQQDQKLQSLVKIYENMKPKDAARIFEDLNITTLLQVAERMKERKLAPIMAAMNPNRAREVTVELTRLRDLPELQPSGG
jgi:flagellar motility protein MotE (MotC chaperone)